MPCARRAITRPGVCPAAIGKDDAGDDVSEVVSHPGLLKYPSRGKHAVGADPVRCCNGTDALWSMPIRASMTPANRRIRFAGTTLIMKLARFSGSVATAQQAPRWP